MLPDRKEARERASKALEPPGQEKRAPLYMVYPTDGGSASVDAGDMLLDFYDGSVRLPNGDEERMSDKLEGSRHGHVNIVAIDRPDQDIDISLDGGGYIRIEADSFRAILFPAKKLRIKLTATTNLRVFGATDDRFLYAEGPPIHSGIEKAPFANVSEVAVTIGATASDLTLLSDASLDNPKTASGDIRKILLNCSWRFQNSNSGPNGLLVTSNENKLQMKVDGGSWEDVVQLSDDMGGCLAQNDMMSVETVHDISPILSNLGSLISLRLSQGRSDADSLYAFLTPWVEVLFKSS